MSSALLKAVSVGRGDLWRVDPRILVVDPTFNVREDFGDMEELVASVIERGVIEPLLVVQRGDQLVIRRGHRRHRACMLAIERGSSVPPVPIRTAPRNHTDLDDTLDFITSNSGKPLTILEEAEVFRRLRDDHKLSADDIAAKTSKSITHVKNCFALLEAPAEILAHIRAGHIAASLVIDLIHENGGDMHALAETVHGALDTAKSQGKAKATRKHVKNDEPPAPPESQPQAPEPSYSPECRAEHGTRTPVGTVPFQDAVSDPAFRERGLSRDSTANMKKFNALLERINADLEKKGGVVPPDVRARLDLAEAIYAALDGTTDLRNVRALILGK